jgi:tRNA threonylcarbamoyladenosine biosynthesis protein TsaE
MSEDNSHVTLISGNPEETFLIGMTIGENLDVSDVVALVGELGTGKTCLTQGIAQGIGVPEGNRITSPSFTLINEYQGRMILYHFDLYRLTGIRDIEDMGYEDYLFGEGVSVIEWADKIKDFLPDQTLFISFKYLDENKRKILISGDKRKVAKISNALKKGGF